MTNLQVNKLERVMPIAFLVLMLASLACGSTTPAQHTEGVSQTPSTATLIPTDTKTPNPTPSSSPFTFTLPQKITNGQGLVFMINQIDLLEEIRTDSKSQKPSNGIFLVMLGTISSSAKKFNCLYASDFSLRSGLVQYTMPKQAVKAAQNIYKRDYPGFFLGQCLDPNKTADSYLLFDVPGDSSDLWLKLADAEIQIGSIVGLMTPTPVPTNTYTPTPTHAPGPKGRATTGVNLRAGPGTDYPKVGGLKEGESVEVLDRTSDGEWYRVRLPDEQLVWVAADYIAVESKIDVIPTISAADIPGTPTSPPPTYTPKPRPTSTPAPKPTNTVIVKATPVPAGQCAGATAICNDGTCSYSAHRRGTCSGHGGVYKWLKDVP